MTPVAKEVTLNRRTFDYYTANEYTSVRLKLYAEDKEQDRTDIIWEEGASADFVVNEDAPKFWSLSATANQLFSAAGESAASVEHTADGYRRSQTGFENRNAWQVVSSFEPDNRFYRR